jgi:preprotein translocase subunit YajC
MFVSPAFAQAGGDVAGAGAGILQFLPLILIFVVFYFLLIRPQQKKLKQHRDMLAAIRRGDRIVTGGGIIGTVNKVIDDNEVMLEIAEGVRVRVHKPLISAVLAKSEAAASSPAEPANDVPTVEPPKNSGVKRFLGGGKKD